VLRATARLTASRSQHHVEPPMTITHYYYARFGWTNHVKKNPPAASSSSAKVHQKEQKCKSWPTKLIYDFVSSFIQWLYFNKCTMTYRIIVRSRLAIYGNKSCSRYSSHAAKWDECTAFRDQFTRRMDSATTSAASTHPPTHPSIVLIAHRQRRRPAALRQNGLGRCVTDRRRDKAITLETLQKWTTTVPAARHVNSHSCYLHSSLQRVITSIYTIQTDNDIILVHRFVEF